jgi:hypothetical protein
VHDWNFCGCWNAEFSELPDHFVVAATGVWILNGVGEEAVVGEGAPVVGCAWPGEVAAGRAPPPT